MMDTTDNLLDRLCTPTRGVRLLWTGNDGWLLWDGTHLLGNDLDLTNFRRLTPSLIDPAELAGRLDLHFITHEHEDHFSMETCRLLARNGRCRFVIPASCAAKADEMELPRASRLPVMPGERFTAAGAEVECIRAIHGHAGGTVYSGASTRDCGYRFRFGGKVFYQPGDTLLLEEHAAMAPVDILFVSPTEHNTWVDGSVRLIRWLRPRMVLLQHFGTYQEKAGNLFWSHGYVEELLAALTPAERSLCLIPQEGCLIEPT